MKISVIVPTRLQKNPFPLCDELYLDRALMSVRRQWCWNAHEWEIIVATDPGRGKDVPERFTSDPVIRVLEAKRASQACAVNAGVEASTGDVLAFLEDDDLWRGEKMLVQLRFIGQGYDFVSCNQREETAIGHPQGSGIFVGVNDFPTPSGWVMPRRMWEKVGPLDESFRWHVDTEWIGRLNASDAVRAHVVETLDPNAKFRPWLANVAQRSTVFACEIPVPLVTRTINPQGGMSTIASNPEATAQSRAEHEAMMRRFGGVPW